MRRVVTMVTTRVDIIKALRELAARKPDRKTEASEGTVVMVVGATGRGAATRVISS